MAFGEEFPRPEVDGEEAEEEEEEEDGTWAENEQSKKFMSVVSFLGIGQEFVGTQNVTSASACVSMNSRVHAACAAEAWQLTVRIQGAQLSRGHLCGVMEALNVPSANSSVITFWEGEVVDNQNYFFFTDKWEASKKTDLEHWSKFPGFESLMEAVETDGAKSVTLTAHPYIFMRWKERFFVNVSADCGLTIAGFYYICYSRADGSIQGFYYDPNSTPFQKLDLKPRTDGRLGHTFGSFTLC